VVRVVEQLAGCSVPASVLESLVLPARVRDYQGGMLDALTSAGEVLWAGHAGLPGGDGWVSLHLADDAPLTLPPPEPHPALDDAQSLPARLARLLRDGGGLFFRSMLEQLDEPADAVEQVLWELVWSGHVGNDTLAPVRARLGASRGSVGRAPRAGRTRGRGGRGSRFAGVRPARPIAAPGPVSGRWFWLPDIEADATVRAHASAQVMLDRHGILTRGAVAAEGTPGGFAAAYRVLSAAEEAGRCRRGYVVEGLGGAQFFLPGSVDRLRRMVDVDEPGRRAGTVVLAAADPANPYGAALPWPETSAAGHRPGRKAGAIVVLVDGDPALFVERGGRTLLSFTESRDTLAPAAHALADAVRRGALGRVTVQRADGASAMTGVVSDVLADAGFQLTPRGLRLRPER
jgi:ATP-dependent Lhr-like helicase